MVNTSSVVPSEVEQFGRLAGDWWDPDGASAMLHKLNPVRLNYVRDRIDQHWGLDERDLRPLAGKTALDVGCGAGLLTEPLARLGGDATGIDASPELVEAAQGHAAAQGLEVAYRACPVEQLPGEFDLVAAMEVVEHVADPESFVAALAARLAPGGLLILSTPNKTLWSKLIMVDAAEAIGAIPKGTHDFDKFVTPERMKDLLEASGLTCIDVRGIAWSPARGLHLSDDLRLNYLVAATRP
jgi:2-polyprenyl-6-hydroxyphenyl methylase/3-demethylubiquinone-9 3-methyltransferase